MTLFNKINKNKQRGFTSIEIMMGIVIVAVLIVIGLTYGSKMLNDSRGKSETESISFLVQKVRDVYSQDPSYSGLDSEVLINTGDLPKSMVNGKNLVNSWKKTLTVKVSSDTDKFTITSEGIPQTQCQTVLKNFSNQALTGKGSSGDAFDNTSTSTDSIASKIIKACKDGDNTVTLTFK